MDEKQVLARFEFAERRMRDLLALGDTFAANWSERQQPLVEYFFHLISAVELLAQLVSERRPLSLPKVSVSEVVKNLDAGDPVKPVLQALYRNPNSKRESMPANPYSDDAYIYRAYNYRHHVTHRQDLPFVFRGHDVSLAALRIDPRLPVCNDENISIKSLPEEMEYMLELFKRKCEEVLAAL